MRNYWKSTLWGAAAAFAILGAYFAIVSAVSGFAFAVDQFAEFRPYLLALAAGFGTQVGLYTYLRSVMREMGSKTALAATGTTSTAAMVSCCTHYLANILPVLGTTGIATFAAEYQIEFFWLGIVLNLAGIAFIGRRILAHHKNQ